MTTSYLLTPWKGGPFAPRTGIARIATITWTIDRVDDTPWGYRWDRSAVAAHTVYDLPLSAALAAEEHAPTVLQHLRLEGIRPTGETIGYWDAVETHPLRGRAGYWFAGACYKVEPDPWVRSRYWFDDLADQYPVPADTDWGRMLPKMPMWARPYRCSVCEGMVDEVGMAVVDRACRCCPGCGIENAVDACPKCDYDPVFR